MAADSYFTISEPARGFYKEKGSKFHGVAFPVFSEEEVKERLAELRTEFYDARHHCYAYKLGMDEDRYRANDDGEPSNSAGMPIFGQIRSHKLTNILIVVVRYFGGTKLGVSGLISAYKAAASLALEEAEIVEQFLEHQVSIRFEYPQMNEVMKIAKNHDLDFSQQEMALDCKIKFSVRESVWPVIEEQLGKVEGLAYQLL